MIAFDVGILPATYRTCRTTKACGPLLLTNFWTRKGPPPPAIASTALPPSAPIEAPVMTRKSYWKGTGSQRVGVAPLRLIVLQINGESWDTSAGPLLPT